MVGADNVEMRRVSNNSSEKDKNVEKSLHYEIIRILRNGDMQSLTILNFNTNDLARKNTQKEVNFLLIPVFHFWEKVLSYRLFLPPPWPF